MKKWDFTELQSLGLVLIIGLGQTGVAGAKWCLSNGLPVRIADTRELPPGITQLEQYKNNNQLQLHLGIQQFNNEIIDGVGTIIISPGVSINDEFIQLILKLAKQKNIRVMGEIELFSLTLNILKNQGYTPKVLAITGTNGKTTVADMTQQIISDNGYSVVAAGNISPCATQALQDCIEQNTLPNVWVLELSSFQLATTVSLDVDCATILNISQDHIDWHGSYEQYIKAKLRLLQMAKHWVINRDEADLKRYIDSLVYKANDIKHNINQALNIPSSSFGNNKPTSVGDIGIETLNDMAWFCYVNNNQTTTNLMPVNAMLLRGLHNAMNAQCAMLLANYIGISLENSLPSVRAYLGQSHRTQYVHSIDEVDFINDSKGTNVGASVAALNGIDAPVVLIAGGLAKDQDFAPLAKAIKNKARHVVLIGQDANIIAKTINGLIEYEFAHSMQDAVSKAFSVAKKGDTVLLSPACASMDMFDSYAQRGQSFNDCVMQLALQQGQVI